MATNAVPNAFPNALPKAKHIVRNSMNLQILFMVREERRSIEHRICDQRKPFSFRKLTSVAFGGFKIGKRRNGIDWIAIAVANEHEPYRDLFARCVLAGARAIKIDAMNR